MKKGNKTSEEKPGEILTKKVILYFFLAILGAISLALIIYISSPKIDTSSLGGPDQFGQFGDYIGGILNPSLGFISVLLLFAAYQLQRTELQKLTESSKEQYILSKNDFHCRTLQDELKNYKEWFYTKIFETKEIRCAFIYADSTKNDKSFSSIHEMTDEVEGLVRAQKIQTIQTIDCNISSDVIFHLAAHVNNSFVATKEIIRLSDNAVITDLAITILADMTNKICIYLTPEIIGVFRAIDIDLLKKHGQFVGDRRGDIFLYQGKKLHY